MLIYQILVKKKTQLMPNPKGISKKLNNPPIIEEN